MKKVAYVLLTVILVFSLTTTAFAEGQGEESILVVMEGKMIILASEDGKITLKLLHGFFISLERLTKTYIFDEYPIIVLRHSSAMIGNKTSGPVPLDRGVCQLYGHFYDGKRDISENLYKDFQK